MRNENVRGRRIKNREKARKRRESEERPEMKRSELLGRLTMEDFFAKLELCYGK
jgi:hypothetical protein